MDKQLIPWILLASLISNVVWISLTYGQSEDPGNNGPLSIGLDLELSNTLDESMFFDITGYEINLTNTVHDTYKRNYELTESSFMISPSSISLFGTLSINETAGYTKPNPVTSIVNIDRIVENDPLPEYTLYERYGGYITIGDWAWGSLINWTDTPKPIGQVILWTDENTGKTKGWVHIMAE